MSFRPEWVNITRHIPQSPPCHANSSKWLVMTATSVADHTDLSPLYIWCTECVWIWALARPQFPFDVEDIHNNNTWYNMN